MASGSENSSRESSPEGDALGKRPRKQPRYLENYTDESLTSMKDSKLLILILASHLILDHISCRRCSCQM